MYPPRTVASEVLGRAFEGALQLLPQRRFECSYVFSGWGGWRYPQFLEHALSATGASREFLKGDGPRLLRRTGYRKFSAARPIRTVPIFRDFTSNFIAVRRGGSEPVMISIDEDYFSHLPQVAALSECQPRGPAVMPYFAHPGMLKRIDGRMVVDGCAKRAIRVGFAGTVTAQHARIVGFDIHDRSAILEHLLEQFGDFTEYAGNPSTWRPSRPIVLATSIPSATGSNGYSNYSLVRDDYLDFLASTDFALAPPGLDMPHSHNLVEAMSQGAIPILNYANWLSPRLQHGVNCLQFQNLAELSTTVQAALEMPLSRIYDMRAEVLRYYESFLRPDSVGRQILQRQPSTLFVNAETHSLRWFPGYGATRPGNGG
jgi:hypothetical protein